MTEQTGVTYVAQITLTLPGQPETATAIVTLSPADRIPVDGRAKPLSECTLAELRAYGNVLEADVWDAYQAISLLELREESQVDIRVMALDESGRATDEVEDWLKHTIVLPSTTAKSSGTDQAQAAENPGKVNDDQEGKTAEVLSQEKAGADPKTETPVEVPSATESAGEPAGVEPVIQTPAPAQESAPKPPTIIPSQARVRVAGRRLPIAESGGAAADVILDEAPLRAMRAHALSSLDREVAGVMIGRQPEKQPDGRYVVHVIDSIVAKHTVMHGASVTYTPESWRYMNDTLWERYPDESAVMVGWYHTHPGFGIFLSGQDQFIHQNFFTQIWHVAYVLDPRARASGFFCWNRQKTKVNRYDFQWPDWAAGSW